MILKEWIDIQEDDQVFITDVGGRIFTKKEMLQKPKIEYTRRVFCSPKTWKREKVFVGFGFGCELDTDVKTSESSSIFVYPYTIWRIKDFISYCEDSERMGPTKGCSQTAMNFYRAEYLKAIQYIGNN